MKWDKHFLDSLSQTDISILSNALSQAKLARGKCLADAGERLGKAYFPTTSILSVITVMRDGDAVESRTIGREGGFGLLHAIGSRYAYERVEVQIAGDAWEIGLTDLAQAAVASQSLLRALAQHAQATIVQAAHSTACIALHSAHQRMCRWLLMTRNRLGADELPLTQEHLAIMLGVQRTTVTAVALDLQAARLISYSRGKIRILDPDGLRERSCECYSAIERAVSQILARP